MNPVRLFYNDVSFNLPGRTKLKLFIPTIFKAEASRPLSELNYIFCTDEFLLNVNKQFLQHDYYTDIITFDLSEPGGGVKGEIYISIDRVRDNASINNTQFQKELHRVIFHGVLHLCGYKDKTKTQATIMRAKEDFYMHLFFSENK